MAGLTVAAPIVRLPILCASRSLRPPKALDAIVDTVLAYKPKPKSNPAKKRKRRANKIAKAAQK